MKLHTIDTELFKLDGGAMFGVVPKSIWQKKYPADENNLCVWAMRCLLIEDEDKLILIDTGLGSKQSDKFFSYYHLYGSHTLKISIQKAGFSVDDITDVIITHFHFDHVGGAIDRVNNELVAAFPNATYWSNQTHWNEATIKPNPREQASFFKENILPLQTLQKIQFVEEKQDVAFSKNVRIRFAYGHTKGLMMPIIQYGNVEIIYISDLIPSIGHLPISYVAGYDSQPLVSMQEKEAMLQYAIENNSVLFFEHDPYFACCNLQMTEKGIREKEVFDLSDLNLKHGLSF